MKRVGVEIGDNARLMALEDSNLDKAAATAVAGGAARKRPVLHGRQWLACSHDAVAVVRRYLRTGDARGRAGSAVPVEARRVSVGRPDRRLLQGVRGILMCASAGPVRVGVAVLLCAVLGNGHAADVVPDIVRIPVKRADAKDSGVPMVTGVFQPAGHGSFPVLIYSHGRSGTESERRHTHIPDMRGPLRYWLKKGFAVVAPIRPGYGETGGEDREGSGVRLDVFGNCWGPPEFGPAATAAKAAVLATLEWVRQQPWADAKRIVLIGTSMGGLTSIATAATNPAGVVGYINFAGGTGGDGTRAPGHSCGSHEMEALMSTYGKTTRVPSLWLYAKNDLYWGAEWPRAWHRAFSSGGSRTDFVMTEPVPNNDGHQLLARGARLWTAHVDRFLDELGF